MTYLNLLEKDNKSSNQLMIMEGRTRVNSSNSETDNIKAFLFERGPVFKVTRQGVDIPLGTSSTVLSDNHYFYDRNNKTLYFKLLPDSPIDLIVHYKLFFSTEGVYWNEIPTDPTSPIVYYEPFISTPVTDAISSADILQGFFPSFATSVELLNVNSYFQLVIRDSSFYRTPIYFYHYVDKLKASSLSLFFVGLVDEIKYNTKTVTLIISDNLKILDDNYEFSSSRHLTYSNPVLKAIDSDFNLDSAYNGATIPSVYGYSPMVKGVNITFSPEVGLFNNTVFSFCQSPETPSIVTATVLSSPSSTVTRTYLNTTLGINPGDGVIHPSGKTCIVSSVESNYINHADTVTAATTGQTVTRPQISRVFVEKGGQAFLLAPIGNSFDGTANYYPGILSASFSGKNISISSILIADDTIGIGGVLEGGLAGSEIVYATIYGEAAIPVFNAVSFGDLSDEYRSITNPVTVIIDILKKRVGLPDSSFDTSSFVDAQTTTTNMGDQIGFLTQEDPTRKGMTYRDIITQICKSSFLKLFLDYQGRYKISHLTYESVLSEDYEINNDDIIEGSFEYDVDYKEIASTINFIYLKSNARIQGSVLSNIPITIGQGNSLSFSKGNIEVTRFHGVSVTKEYTTLQLETGYFFLDYSDKVLALFGFPFFKAKLSLPIKFYPIDLGTRIKIRRKDIPGFTPQFDLSARIFLVTSVSRSLSGVELELEDPNAVLQNPTIFSGA